MYFFTKVEYYDCENHLRIEKGLLYAMDYSDAMSMITNAYGEKEIEKILLIEPFTDNSIVVIDDIIEAHIRENEANGF